jgi:hypothetical protein
MFLKRVFSSDIIDIQTLSNNKLKRVIKFPQVPKIAILELYMQGQQHYSAIHIFLLLRT